jgi:hypothetical protein
MGRTGVADIQILDNQPPANVYVDGCFDFHVISLAPSARMLRRLFRR